MKLFTKEEWVDYHISKIPKLANKNGLKSLNVEVVTFDGIPQKTIDSVCQAINETIDEIGSNHKLVDVVYDNNLKELVERISPHNQSLMVNSIMPYFRPEETTFKSIINTNYKNNLGIKIIVTQNNGVYQDNGEAAKAGAQSYSGLVYLPIPKQREHELSFTKDLAKHELGHVFGLKAMHHDTLASRGSFIVPYQVIGYDKCDNCYMNHSLTFVDNYLSNRQFCNRYLDTTRKLLFELKKINGVNYI